MWGRTSMRFFCKMMWDPDRRQLLPPHITEGVSRNGWGVKRICETITHQRKHVYYALPFLHFCNQNDYKLQFEIFDFRPFKIHFRNIWIYIIYSLFLNDKSENEIINILFLNNIIIYSIKGWFLYRNEKII